MTDYRDYSHTDMVDLVIQLQEELDRMQDLLGREERQALLNQEIEELNE